MAIQVVYKEEVQLAISRIRIFVDEADHIQKMKANATKAAVAGGSNNTLPDVCNTTGSNSETDADTNSKPGPNAPHASDKDHDPAPTTDNVYGADTSAAGIPHHSIGSPDKSRSLLAYQNDHAANPLFQSLRARLQTFLRENLPDQDALTLLDSDKVRSPLLSQACCGKPKFSPDLNNPAPQVVSHKVAYIRYESEDDWNVELDRIRCNPSFWGAERRDTIIAQGEPGSYLFARVMAIFRLTRFPEHPVALVRYFNALPGRKWMPPTDIGMQVMKEESKPNFMLLSSIVRGCHMIPTFHDPKKGDCFYLNDLVDPDMYLRLASNIF